jgi:hypothetical protein
MNSKVLVLFYRGGGDVYGCAKAVRTAVVQQD